MTHSRYNGCHETRWIKIVSSYNVRALRAINGSLRWEGRALARTRTMTAPDAEREPAAPARQMDTPTQKEKP
jgi:hypothetical protein